MAEQVEDEQSEQLNDCKLAGSEWVQLDNQTCRSDVRNYFQKVPGDSMKFKFNVIWYVK
jgi:hypothetical protein